MGKNRDEGGPSRMSSLMGYLPTSLRYGSSHSDSRTPVRNKVVAAVVATGALVTVGQPLLADDSPESPENDVKSVAAQQSMQAAANGTPETSASVELRGAQPAEVPASAPQPPKPDQGQASASDQESGKDQVPRNAQTEKERAHKEAQRKAIEEQVRLKKAFARQAAEQAAAKEAAAKEAAAKEQKAAEQAAEKKAAAPAPEPKVASVSDSGGKLVDSGRLTSGYHTRGGSHAGIDVGADLGTPIHAPSAGEVISSGSASGFGKWVRIKHDDGKVTVYGHIHSSQVNVGDQVKAGEQIATVGSRGQSTGPHLHFEVRHGAGGQETNPLPWLKDLGYSIA